MTTATKRKAKKPKALRVKKLSSLLAIGLRDLRKQERAKDSVVNMAEWYRCNGKCTACLAGSVLRFSMGFGRQKGYFDGSEFSKQISRQMEALNDLRSGYVGWAKQLLAGGSKFSHPLDCWDDMPRYDGPGGEWWKRIKQLHADLVAAGE